MPRSARLVCCCLIACMAFALYVSHPAMADVAQQKRLAVWMWGSTVRSQGAEAIAKKLADERVTDVILLVRGTSGKAEYASAIAPPAEAGKDALGDIIAACRPLGIRVHAWFVFNQDKAYTDAHPEDRIWHHGKANTEFKPYEIDDGKVCPASAAHLEYTNSLIREVMEKYSVDGIHLDYIRYGHMVYCFCPAHIEKATKLGINVDKVREAMFQTLYASPANPNHLFEAYAAGEPDVVAWVNMRQAEVREAAASMRAAAKSINPNVVFSASLMPEGAIDESKPFAMCHYGQSYDDAGKLYDFVCPMAYHIDYSKPAEWVGDITRGTVQAVGDVPIYIGLQAYPDKCTYDELKAAALAGLDAGAAGVALFRFGTMTGPRWAAIKDVMEGTK
ncbi:MAG TPA: family 10 glycosylhydrolase [Bacillota bacterium]|nr:family 10 glycosylhydrolase [Bacillota bacterium]